MVYCTDDCPAKNELQYINDCLCQYSDVFPFCVCSPRRSSSSQLSERRKHSFVPLCSRQTTRPLSLDSFSIPSSSRSIDITLTRREVRFERRVVPHTEWTQLGSHLPFFLVPGARFNLVLRLDRRESFVWGCGWGGEVVVGRGERDRDRRVESEGGTGGGQRILEAIEREYTVSHPYSVESER